MGSYSLNEPYIHSDAFPILSSILASGWVSSVSEAVAAFEEMLSEYMGIRYAFACQSGTAGLHLALLSLGIGRGDIVLVPDITFIAPVNTVAYVGAEPVFIDTDRDLNISPRVVKDFISSCERKRGRPFYMGRPVKAMIVVHVLGNPCDMQEVLEICRDNKIRLIEDATESLGATLVGKMLGGIGDVGVVSFNGNKIITTGAGGAVVSNNRRLIEKVRYLGMQAKDDGLYYIHNDVGYNYRMSALQAGLGISQLKHIQEHLDKKKMIHQWYKKAFRRVGGISILEPIRGEGNFWINAIKLKGKDIRRFRDRLIDELLSVGIQVRPLWLPNHLQRPYKDCPYFGKGNSIRQWESTLCLPSDIRMRQEDVERVVEMVKEVWDGARD